MRLLMSAVIFAAATAVAVPTSAQTTGSSSSTQKPASTAKPAKPKTPKLPVGYRAFFILETEAMAASLSFKAVTGSSAMFGYGGGGEVLNVWRKLFLRAGLSSASKSGDRVFVMGGVVIPTGATVDVGMRTVEIGAGWRTYLKKHPNTAIYYGGGLVFVNYTENSPLGVGDENVSDSFRGYAIEGGFEAALSKWITAGVEGQYRTVPNALGTGGVSASLGDTNLGGLAIRVMVGIRFKK